MTPAAIYLRVSKDDGSQTTDNQRPAVVQMAAGRGYNVSPAHIYVDEASGGKGREERPALDRLLVAAARGEFRAVLIWALDRLSRDDSYSGGAAMVAELDRLSVAVISYQETWMDTSGPFRTVLVQFSMLIAADFLRRLKARTHAGIDRARGQLQQNGRYWNARKSKWVTHIGRKRAEVAPAVLDRAAELYAELHSWRAVARALRLSGVQGLPSHATLALRCAGRIKPGGTAEDSPAA